MTRARHLGAILLFGTIALASAVSPASAALKLCNRTSYVLYASTASEVAGAMRTQGWLRIVPGSCAVAIAGTLSASPYYVYARTSHAHSGPAHAWGGHTGLCVKDIDYTLDTPLGAPRCQSDDAFARPFATLMTGGKTDWTTTFTQTPPLASWNAARQAGVARLLGDVGYKLGPGRGGSIGTALDQFRTRMKLAADAGLTDLFDALETEAMKVASPSGYAICNDTDAPVWAALGYMSGKTAIARGWWKVMPGACARAIATRLTWDRVYLLVEGHGNRRLVSGKENFCVAGIAFEIEGRTHCAARGLTTAGFAVTSTRGLSGFTAHVSEDGLLPPQRGAN